jgi:uncharacterized membrane protein
MKTKNLVLAALLIALSFIGSNIKIMQTIAFDSMPAFLGTLILGPFYGAVIGSLGHFLTALTSGFPYTIPVHLVIMVGMALTMVSFGYTHKYFSKKSKATGNIMATIVAVIINGPVLTLLISPMLIPLMGKAGLIALLPVLCSAAALNVIIALVVYNYLPKRYK